MMNARQAGNVLRRNAPQGEHPAYISNQEASWLKGMGGSGKKTKSGLRSYYAGSMTGDDNFGERGRSEKDWSYSASDIGNLDVGGWVADKFGGRSDQGKLDEHQRVANMGQRGFDAQGNPIEGIVQGGADATGQIRDSLGNLVSGGGQQTRNNTSSSVSEIDKPTHEFRKDIYDRTTKVMDTPYEKYGGKRFADASADTLTAQTGVRDMQGVGQGAYTSAGNTATGVQGTNIDPISGQSFLTGQGVDEYMSPHTSNVISGMQDNAMRTMQMSRNQLGANAQMAGAGMGSRSAIEKGVMAAGVQRDLGQQVAGALEGSYAQAAGMKEKDMTREQQRQRYNQMATGEEGKLRLAGAETGIRATDAGRKAGYEDSSMLSRVGADIEGRDQNEKDFAYDEHIEGRDWDKNNAMFGSNVLSGAPVGTTTTQNNPQYRNQRVDKFGRIIAGAAGGWLASGGNPYGAAVGGGMAAMDW
jgi:hypothetical protein